MRSAVCFLLLFISLSTYAQTRHIITSDSTDLFIEVKGSGIPCLYIHGGPGSGSYWLEKFFGPFLEKHFQMVYLDQRGTGRSKSPRDMNFSMERMVKDFEEVRLALGVKDWIILGHSFGGILQMGYAQRFPEAIKGMIMVDCSLNMNESLNDSWIPKACKLLNITDTAPYLDKSISPEKRLEKIIPELQKKDLFWKMAFKTKESEEKMDRTYSEIPNWNNDLSANAMTREEYFADYKKFTSEIKTPVLFFYGTNDWMIGPEHYKGVNFPNMQLSRCNGGHIPFLENQKDLEKAISRYLQKYKF